MRCWGDGEGMGGKTAVRRGKAVRRRGNGVGRKLPRAAPSLLSSYWERHFWCPFQTALGPRAPQRELAGPGKPSRELYPHDAQRGKGLSPSAPGSLCPCTGGTGMELMQASLLLRARVWDLTGATGGRLSQSRQWDPERRSGVTMLGAGSTRSQGHSGTAPCSIRPS